MSGSKIDGLGNTFMEPKKGTVFYMPPFWAVPLTVSHLICTCAQAGKGISHPDDPNSSACGTCKKYFRYQLSRCSTCSEPYLLRFSHPLWCPCTNRCWTCLMQLPDDTVPCEKERCLTVSRNKRLSPPLPWHTRKTPEEVASMLELSTDYELSDFDF